jgi:hypothetical protein
MAVVLHTDGNRGNIDLSTFTLQERLVKLREIVGGYLESVPIGGGLHLLFWEDGKDHNLPANFQATMIADGHLMEDDYIAGVAVLAAQNELDN